MRILAVVVRYKTPLEHSQTIQGLCKAFKGSSELAQSFRVFIWDNTPEPLTAPQLPIPFEYRHTGENLGVSGAYNNAMQYALDQGHTWMLLLDQDSTVTAEFLQTMLLHAHGLEGQTEIAAIAPIVKSGNVVVSPKMYVFSRTIEYRSGGCGPLPGEAIAINSGCLMRASALYEIGGFSSDFWLDYSDIYVFHQFYLHGKKVWRAADVTLQHELSIMDYDRLMTPWRYRNFSYAETAFHDLYKGRLENAIQTVRLFLRAIKQRMKYKNPEFSRIAWEQFLYRVRVPRERRLAEWKAEGESRRTPSGS